MAWVARGQALLENPDLGIGGRLLVRGNWLPGIPEPGGLRRPEADSRALGQPPGTPEQERDRRAGGYAQQAFGVAVDREQDEGGQDGQSGDGPEPVHRNRQRTPLPRQRGRAQCSTPFHVVITSPMFMLSHQNTHSITLPMMLVHQAAFVFIRSAGG